MSGWIEEQPGLNAFLRRIKNTPRSYEFLQNLYTIVEQKQAILLSPVAIYESELRAMGLEAASWDTETGGDLFGLWETLPIVYLATRAGPGAIRNHAHFKLDVDYLRCLSVELDDRWGLRYLGDWHSHHRLGLSSPSTGDGDRIKRLGSRNGFLAMLESIVTFEAEHGSATPIIKIHPYIYPDLQSSQPVKVPFIVLKGISPLREALIADEALKEQELSSWNRFPVERLRIPPEPLPPVNSGDGVLCNFIGERVLRLARKALETVSGEVTEHHKTSFGHILVAPAGQNVYVGIALDASWPYRVLEVDWIDRYDGTSGPLEIPVEQENALNPRRLVELYIKARGIKGQIEEKE